MLNLWCGTSWFVQEAKRSWTRNSYTNTHTHILVLTPCNRGWEAKGRLASPEISCLLWAPKVHFRAQDPATGLFSISCIQVTPSLSVTLRSILTGSSNLRLRPQSDLVETPFRKWPLGRWSKWEDNIKMVLSKISSEHVKLMKLPQDLSNAYFRCCNFGFCYQSVGRWVSLPRVSCQPILIR